EARARAPSVLAARSGPDGRQPEVVAAAPVAADLAERGKAHVLARRRDAHAVDSGAADDRDAPASLGAGAQDGEGAVAGAHAVRPPERADRYLEPPLLLREVEPCEEQHCDVRPHAARLLAQRLEHAEGAVDAEVLRRAVRAAHDADQ